ncbi:DUF3089 domain-containing protein [Novosphingobium sp. 9U]|uniref:DUF3089 domain-containing protein n=1 Tax=Novosphingobium sp. 9U TaxID=2653158 RepID=UPI0012F2DF79|nr:DUF3089 domain-containing protein [Novosphingobium sp. 9U]VWX53288.1 conserved hypothetical protein [Novosphingobium sp. 9U]
MARKFLYIVTGLVVLVLLAFLALRIFAQDLTEIAFVPSAKFTDQPKLAEASYDDPDMWLARPGMKNDAARWLPSDFAQVQASEAASEGADEAAPAVTAESKVDAAVFFVHPTGLVSRSSWNASLDDQVSRQRSRLFVQGMASPFNASPDVWAPRYRQAAVGAFLTDAPEATQALDLAYRDVAQAFDTFVKSIGPGQPIVLAGHSQGAFHLRRLIRDRIAGTPLAKRIAVAYIIGWPVSNDRDLPLMGMPACKDATSTGCVVSWLSFADPPETEMLLRAYARRRGLDGQEVGADPSFVCVNPISGVEDGKAAARENLGTLVPDLAQGTGTLAPGVVPAQCGKDHLLHIGAPPDLDMGPYVLPGNNYHLYDITLFWANLRADLARRVGAFSAK